MPFKSEKQRRYLYSQKPDVAAQFARDSKSTGGKMEKHKKHYEKSRSLVAKRSKHAEHAPREKPRKRPGKHKKSLNKAEKRQKKLGRYKGQGRG